MNIWSWIHEFYRKAEAEGDADRTGLVQLFDSALESKETDPDRTLAMLEQGKAQAKGLKEPRWVLFFEHWILQTQLFFRRDYRPVLDLAVKASLEACKPAYRDFPQRVCIHEDLIHGYVGIDPEGYADKIVAALEFMKGEADPKAECQHCILGCQSSFEAELERYDAARAIAEIKLKKALDERSDHHAASACSRLAELAIRRRDWDAALAMAKETQQRARATRRDSVEAVGLVYEAVALRALGREPEALKRYARGVRKIKRLAIPSNDIYETIAWFYEMGGDDAKALRFRDKQFKVHGRRGQLLSDFRILKERCRLLHRLGRLEPADLETARDAARKLRFAEKHLAELESFAQPQA